MNKEITIDYEYMEEKAKGKCPKCGNNLFRIEEYDSIGITDVWDEYTQGYDNTVDKDYGNTVSLVYECSNKECGFKYIHIKDGIEYE